MASVNSFFQSYPLIAFPIFLYQNMWLQYSETLDSSLTPSFKPPFNPTLNVDKFLFSSHLNSSPFKISKISHLLSKPAS